MALHGKLLDQVLILLTRLLKVPTITILWQQLTFHKKMFLFLCMTLHKVGLQLFGFQMLITGGQLVLQKSQRFVTVKLDLTVLLIIPIAVLSFVLAHNTMLMFV
jgi:hypothetical protein